MPKTILEYRPVKPLDVSDSNYLNEVKRRTPWIFFSVLAGIIMIYIGQMYEYVFPQKLELIFFIPMIVYMSDSIGTETLALFVRALALKKLSIKQIFLKEVFVGFSLGLASGIPMGIFSYLWFRDTSMSLVITITMIVNGLTAVLVGMLIPIIFSKIGRDPALGTDEITTAISDNLSILIYLFVATFMLFGFS